MEWIAWVVLVTEVLGTVAFSISGAITGIQKKMDVLGVVVLGVATAVGGGVIRDLLLGNTPPAAFCDPTYVAWATVTALVVFFLARYVWLKKELRREELRFFEAVLNLVDSLGLGLFAVIGVQTAIDCGFGENHFLAVFVGTLTGVGGGVLRDTLAGEVPKIFRKRIYALAALAGAWLYDCLAGTSLHSGLAILAASGVVVVIRLLAAHFEWDLPRIP